MQHKGIDERPVTAGNIKTTLYQRFITFKEILLMQIFLLFHCCNLPVSSQITAERLVLLVVLWIISPRLFFVAVEIISM